MEKRTFVVMREKVSYPVINWLRVTDGCSATYKSRFTNDDLVESLVELGLNNVSWMYLESYEGKNRSDSFGMYNIFSELCNYLSDLILLQLRFPLRRIPK